MPCVSFVERSVAPSPVAHCHILLNIIISVILAGLLQYILSIPEAEKPGVVVHGLVSKTKHRKNSVKCAVISFLLFILGAFPPEGWGQEES